VARTIRRVTLRTRTVLLAVFALAWVLLGAVNLAKGRTGVGVLYVVLGVLIAALAATGWARRRR